MTPLEHGLVGFNAAIALGLHNRGGWKIIAMGTFATMVPDWDWLACLWGDNAFQTIHRVWGHAIVSCLLTAILVASADYYLDGAARGGSLLNRCLPKRFRFSGMIVREQRYWNEYCLWLAAAIILVFTHPVADLLVTGGVDFPPWPVQLFWPFSSEPFTCPILNWGDPGILMVFGLGLIAMLRFRNYSRIVAFSVFIALGLYALLR